MFVPANRPAASSYLSRAFGFTVPWDSFTPGEHVRVSRGLYWHHAIYAGAGRVIEFGSSIYGGTVGIADWESFARGATVEVVAHNERFDHASTLQRAVNEFGRDNFDLLAGNCEHFANWCATGRWESGQAAFAKFIAGIGAVALFFKFAA